MSTRAVAVIAALTATVVALVGVLLWTLMRPDDAPPVTASGSETATPTFHPSAGDAGENHGSGPAETQEAAWGPVADQFAEQFTNTRGGATAWRQRLLGDGTQPDVTADVAKQLATVDVANVPDGSYEGRELLKSSEYDLAVKVTYREGWAMVLYLITDGTRWQIYAYDKWEP